MNKKLIKVKKTTLATVMATSMGFSAVSTLPVLAEETPTEEIPVEEVPVDTEETAPTPKAEASEQSLNLAPMVQTLQSIYEAAPVQDTDSESSLQQSSSFAPGYSEENTADELKTKLAGLIEEAEGIWNEKGGFDYFKNNVEIRQAVEKKIPKAKEYLAEGKSTAKTFSWRCYEMESVIKSFNSESNVLGELQREVYALAKVRDSLNPNQYTSSSWDVYTKAVYKALTTANGSGGEARLPEEIEAIKTAFAALAEVDENVFALKELVSEVDTAIIQVQQNPETSVNYERESWYAFTTAYAAAQNELNKNNAAIDAELFNTLKANLVDAKSELVIASEGAAGQEAGVLENWKDYQKIAGVRGGKLFVSNEVVNKDGTSTITVKWINDGTDPFTGGLFHNQGSDYMNSALNKFGEWSLRPITESDLRTGDMLLDVIYTYNGETTYIGIDRLTEEQSLQGFEETFVVPSGASVKLEMGQWNGNTRTFSLGTYYTQLPDTTAPVINAEDVTLTVGDTFDALKGVTATDDVDGDLTNSIVVSGDKVDTTKAGTYKVTYTVADAAGNEATKTITVTVKEKPDTGKPEEKPDTGKPEEEKPDTNDKEDSKKEDGIQTSVGLSAGLYAGIMGISAAGLGVLEVLKRRKK